MMTLKKQYASYGFIAILIIALSVQGWFLYDLHQMMQESSIATDQDITSRIAPAPADPFDAFSSQAWDPFKEMQRLQDNIDQLFGQSLGRFDNNPDFSRLFSSSGFHPKIDMRETDEAYIVDVDVPGADEQNLNVSIDGRQLTIEGSIEQRINPDPGNRLYHERRSGRFSRSVSLPEPVDAARMQTQFNNGVLRITVPKAG